MTKPLPYSAKVQPFSKSVKKPNWKKVRRRSLYALGGVAVADTALHGLAGYGAYRLWRDKQDKDKVKKSIKTPYGIARVRIKTRKGYFGSWKREHEITARLKGQQIGDLKLMKPKRGKREVGMIGVDPSMRRQGVARLMYQQAERKGLRPRHSTSLLPLGEKFVRGMGHKRVRWYPVPKESKKAKIATKVGTTGFPEAQHKVATARFGKPIDESALSEAERHADTKVAGITRMMNSVDPFRFQRSTGAAGVKQRLNRVRTHKQRKALKTAAEQWRDLGTEAASGINTAWAGKPRTGSVFWRNQPHRQRPEYAFGKPRYSVDEHGNLIHHSGKEVHKAMIPPRAVRYLAPIRRHPVIAGGIGAAAVGGGGVYTYGSLQGTNLRANARTGYQSEMDKYQRMIEERSRDPRYKHRGNQVYVKNRRWFRESTEPAIEQLVRENKKGPALYVDIDYDKPWGSSAATTYTSDKSRATSMTLRPGQRNSRENRARGRFYAVHEHQHVKDYAGKGKQKPMMENALKVAYRKAPAQGAFKDFVTGRGWKRLGAYTHRMDIDVGYGEGRADRAASQRLGIDAGHISGYPAMAALDPHFGRGYNKGMGRLRS